MQSEGASGRAASYLRLAVVIATPLAFNPWGRRVFEPEKAAVLRLLAAAMVGILVLRLASPRRVPVGGRLPPILARLALLAAVFLVASAVSLSPRASLLGSHDWRQGALTFLACLALFVSAYGDATRGALTSLLNAVETTSAAVAVYGLLQCAGLDPIPWVRPVEGRVFSTFGHPNFLAAYLLLTVFPVLSRLVSARSTRARALHAAVCAVQLACLFVTYSRSGWLGLLIGGICLAWLLGRDLFARRLKVLAAPALALVLAFLALAFADPGGLFTNSPLEPIHSLLRGKSATAGVRVLIWHGAADALRARPLLGYGPETFDLSLPRAYPPALAIYGGVRAAGAHAHNEWLDWGLSAGLLGLLAYLWLLGSALWNGVRSLPALDDETRALRTGLIAAAVAYLVQNQMSFGTVAPLAHFWMYLGLIAAVPAAGQSDVPPAGACLPAPGTVTRVALIAYAVTALLAVGMLEGRAVASDTLAGLGDRAGDAGDLLGAQSAYARAILLSPHEPRFWADLAEAYLKQSVATPGRDAEARFVSGARALDRSVELCPSDPALHSAVARLYYAWGAAGRADAWDRAAEAYRQASALSPSDPDIWCRWGRVYHARGEYDRAIEKYGVAVSLDPLHAVAFTYMAEAHLAGGEFPQAREDYDRAEAVAAEADRRVSKR